MRALLFNPWITDFAAFDHWTRPLNLLRLASLLRNLDWEVVLYDCLDRRKQTIPGYPRPHSHRLNPYGCGHYYREEIPKPESLQFIDRDYKRYGIPYDYVEFQLSNMPQPDVVLIPCMMTYWYPGAFQAIQMIKRIFPQSTVILGGVYPTLCPEHAQTHSQADDVIVGKHWPELVNIILTTLNEQPICEGNQSTWIEPAYDLLNGDSCLPVLTTTGCPCYCTYCATHELWPNYVFYPIENIIDSIERGVNEYKATDMVFYDDALLVKKDRHFIPIMEELLSRDIHVRFHTPNALHVRQINQETAYLLKRAGFTTIRLGFETSEQDIQKETGGKVTTDEYLNAMQYLLNAGFSAREVGTYLLLGLPGQSFESVWQAARMVARSGSEIKLAMFSPLPSTALFESELNEFQFDHRIEPLLQNNSLTPWRSRLFSHDDVQKLKRYIVDTNLSLRQKGRISA